MSYHGNLLARFKHLITEGFDVTTACQIVNRENDCPEIRIVRGSDGTGRVR